MSSFEPTDKLAKPSKRDQSDSRAHTVVLSAISDIRPGVIVTADTIREATMAAQLPSAEISGALRNACTDGFLTMPTLLLDDGLTLVRAQIKSTHPAGKGRYVSIYRRSEKPVPSHVCGGAA